MSIIQIFLSSKRKSIVNTKRCYPIAFFFLFFFFLAMGVHRINEIFVVAFFVNSYFNWPVLFLLLEK